MRPYHSPSSIALGLQCKHAWALQYIDGKRDPDVQWDTVKAYVWDHGRSRYVGAGGSCTAAQRGAALGKVMHATLESWYLGGEPDWHTFPGLVAHSGKHHLPEPSKIVKALVERPIGSAPLPERGANPHAPSVAIEVSGVRWAGYVDLFVHAPDELRRLGVISPDGVAVIDYKSTSKIDSYALTSDDLLANPQAALYAIDACERLGVQSIAERWVYFESKKIRRSIAVDVTAELSRAHDVIGPCADLARELDMISLSAEAPKNLAACNMYGPPDRINCRHHTTNGGTCDARRRFGPVTQLRTKKEEIVMAISEEMQAKIAERQAAFAAKRGVVDEEKSDVIETIEAESEEAPDAPEITKVVTRAPAKPAPAPKAAKAADGSQAATIAALAAELAAADKQRADVLARLRSAVG